MSRFVAEHLIEGTLLCDVESRVAESLVVKLIVHAAANIINLFEQTFIVLHMKVRHERMKQCIVSFRAHDVAVLFIKFKSVRWLSSWLLVITNL